MPKNTDGNDNSEKIEIFSTDDEKIKAIGEILSNESSRTILQLLLDNELTANETSNKLLISLQLVTYHIKKMQELGFVKISKVTTNSKGHDMKHYTATKISIVIVPSFISEKTKESKSLKRSFKSIYHFAGIVTAGIIAWFSTIAINTPIQNPNTNEEPIINNPSIKERISEPVIDAIQHMNNPGTINYGDSDLVLPIIITSVVILIGITIEIIWQNRLRNQSKVEQVN